MFDQLQDSPLLSGIAVVVVLVVLGVLLYRVFVEGADDRRDDNRPPHL